MTDTIRAALIYGSTREGRLCDSIADWVGKQIADHGGFLPERIDPAVLDLPPRHERKNTPGVAALRRRIEQAEAFIVVTPEYNHGYPAALKFLIDSAYKEWRAKPVAFVSYGGASGGLRAVEQLRQVFAVLHAVTISSAVSFAGVWQYLDDAGELRAPPYARKSMNALLAQLQWWANALRAARTATPYADVAA